MKKEIVIAIFICCIQLLEACTQHEEPIVISLKEFKVTMPYEVDRVGIYIDTQWGTDNTIKRFYLDNHSPTWANDSIIVGNSAIRKSKNYDYRTTTAEGSEISGNVYICDSISVAGILFRNVPFYRITGSHNRVQGVIGENIITKAVWKFDFKNKLITFASHIDSLGDRSNAKQFNARFTSHGIEFDVNFRNNIRKPMQLDLGFNLSLLMPANEFKEIVKGNEKHYALPFSFSTPSGIQQIETINAFDSVQIDKTIFKCIISSNELAKEALIGRGFFEQFDFIIIDYLNKSIYLSKNRQF